MCREWIAYITAAMRALWGIPAEEWAALLNLFVAAEEWLAKAEDVAERSHVISAACREAFAALEAKMCLFRDRYFKMPPLTKEDWAALGFKEQGDPRAPAGVPTA
jgi:hypothetical protein